MSGIAGVFFRNGQTNLPGLLQSQRSAMRHRGERGTTWIGENGGLLSIFPPVRCSKSKDVMARMGSLVVAFDGRIDNRDEVAGDLKAKGFKPPELDGDAELAIRAFSTWENKSFDRLIGDFAIAVFDEQTKCLVLARDPADTRGIFYIMGRNYFAFGSELSATTCIDKNPTEYEPEYFFRYMLTGQRTYLTPYRNIFRLQAGCTLTIDLRTNEKRIDRYWEPFARSPIRYRDETEYTKQFFSLFEEAVRCRLPSKEPVGITLSGGLDSGAIGCVASDLLRAGKADVQQIHTVSYLFTDPESDEREYIEANVGRMGIKPHYLDGEALLRLSGRDLTRESAFYPEPCNPFASQLLHASMNTLSELGVHALLCGHFGDHLFDYNLGMLRDFFWQGRWRTLAAHLKYWAEPMQLMPLTLLKTAFQPDLSILVPEAWFTETKPQILSPADPPLRQNSRSHAQNAAFKMQSTTREDLGHSHRLAYGLDYRLPFRDRRLVEFSLLIPREQLHVLDTTKVLLRRAMVGVLPDIVRNRHSKSGQTGMLFEHYHQELSVLKDLWKRYGDVLSNYLDHKRVVEGFERAAYGDSAALFGAERLAPILRWLGAQDIYSPVYPYDRSFFDLERLSGTYLAMSRSHCLTICPPCQGPNSQEKEVS